MLKQFPIRTQGFLHATATLAYVACVVGLLSNAERFFGPDEKKTMLIPLFMLLLFVFSAAVTALLVLGRPIHFYLSGAKKEGITLLAWTLGWLFGYVFLVALAMVRFA